MGGIRHGLLSLLLLGSTMAFLICRCAAAEGEHAQQQPYLELNVYNYEAVAAATASSRREILLTTVDISYRNHTDPDRVVDLFMNMAWHLSRLQRLENLLVVSYSAESCWYLIRAGIPCFTDKAARQPQDLPGIHGQRPPTFAKYWHALALARLNYSLLVLDPDVSTVQDPFQYHDRGYDIEGLSDWNFQPDVPSPQSYLEQGCSIYRMVRRAESAGESVEGFWLVEPGNHVAAVKHLSVCQSTGLWFAEPRPATIRFLEHMIQWMLVHAPNQWEQAAWNEVIMAHLFGDERREPLRYRLLSVRHFLNLPTYQLRRQGDLDIELVLLHAGGLHGRDKDAKFKAAGYWGADQWLTSIGRPLIDKFAVASKSA